MISEQDRDYLHARIKDMLDKIEKTEADGPNAKYNSESWKSGLRFGIQRVREEVLEKI
jgi:hypothetical protein